MKRHPGHLLGLVLCSISPYKQQREKNKRTIFIHWFSMRVFFCICMEHRDLTGNGSKLGSISMNGLGKSIIENKAVGARPLTDKKLFVMQAIQGKWL